MLIEIDGVRLITDPVLRDRVGPLVRIVPDAHVVGPVDCVLLSHLHADHTDLPSLRALDRSGPVVAPYPAGKWLTGKGVRDVRELLPEGELGVGGLRISATAAVHDSRRRPFGPEAEPVGYVIHGSSSVYFAGDTDLFVGMAELRGNIDVALLPVWGWGASVGAGHLDPTSAAEAAALIAPARSRSRSTGARSRCPGRCGGRRIPSGRRASSPSLTQAIRAPVSTCGCWRRGSDAIATHCRA